MKRFIRRRIANPFTLIVAAGALVLAGCTDTSGDIRELAGVSALAAPIAQPAPPTTTAQIIEATAAVTQPAQVIEVTRIVEATVEVQIIVTATPEVAGFPPSTSSGRGIDESVQPCPARYWKRGRCTATQAQIDQAASEVQP